MIWIVVRNFSPGINLVKGASNEDILVMELLDVSTMNNYVNLSQ